MEGGDVGADLPAHGDAEAATARTEPSPADLDRFAATVLQVFETDRAHTFHGLWTAIEQAVVECDRRPDAVPARTQRLKDFFVKDLTHLGAAIVHGPRGRRGLQTAGDTGGDALGAMSRIVALAGDGLYRIAGQGWGRSKRRAGDVTCSGAIACAGCGSRLRLRSTARLGACGDCGGTDFNKVMEDPRP